eukprot:TRINITY_DN1727_c0_g1_i8.p1 TRINITY_DN1727_c0_g1~~TRINITY_DN1727_c0_g1_i8.p1  ORF type:complete len:201 (+),score=-6.19 TRINITY_DN1727_c0_g1_i8:249-851(+)
MTSTTRVTNNQFRHISQTSINSILLHNYSILHVNKFIQSTLANSNFTQKIRIRENFGDISQVKNSNFVNLKRFLGPRISNQREPTVMSMSKLIMLEAEDTDLMINLSARVIASKFDIILKDSHGIQSSLNVGLLLITFSVSNHFIVHMIFGYKRARFLDYIIYLQLHKNSTNICHEEGIQYANLPNSQAPSKNQIRLSPL